jgi:tRNA1Val (adenine37-N6)-methyltransferase
MEDLVRVGERLDDLGRKGYRIIQDPKKFCFGMDAVLLSSFADAKEGERVLDLCTGNGILPILLEAKTAGESFVGLEIQEESASLARRSVSYNHLDDKIEIVTGDLKDASKIFGASSFDVVTSNPPYMIGGHGLKNPDDAKMIARHEVLMELEDLIRETAKLLKPQGRCYFVHRPFRLVEILSLMHEYKIEPKRMRLVYPYADKEPNMVLIEGVRGGKPRLTVEKPLIVYKEENVYTDEVKNLYFAEDPS